MLFPLNDKFLEERARSVEWNGQTVYRYFQLEDVAPGSVIRYERLSSRWRSAQGISVDVEGAKLRIANDTGKEFSLWSNTAPKRFEFEIAPARKKTVKLGFENIWLGSIWKNTESSIGHSGFLVEQEGNSVLLRCSDGLRKVSFRDLVVRFTIIPPVRDA